MPIFLENRYAIIQIIRHKNEPDPKFFWTHYLIGQTYSDKLIRTNLFGQNLFGQNLFGQNLFGQNLFGQK